MSQLPLLTAGPRPSPSTKALVPVKKPVRRKPRRRPIPGKRLIAVALALGLIGGGVFAWRSGALTPANLAGYVGQGVVSLTGFAGLRVHDLLVDGRQMADRQAVMDALDISRDMPILGYQAEAARLRLEAVPWVESAVIERRLPDTIYVRITERHPLALWQHNGKFSLIDANGVEIALDQLGPYASLPVVVGEGAPEAAEEMLMMLDVAPTLKARVTAAVRVAGRRWNLRLDNRVDLKLPEEDPALAWASFANLERDQKLLEREITAVDMRQPDRLIVQVTPRAAEILHLNGPKPVLPKPAEPQHATVTSKPPAVALRTP
jgi:cell division protein FtsQ